MVASVLEHTFKRKSLRWVNRTSHQLLKLQCESSCAAQDWSGICISESGISVPSLSLSLSLPGKRCGKVPPHPTRESCGPWQVRTPWWGVRPPRLGLTSLSQGYVAGMLPSPLRSKRPPPPSLSLACKGCRVPDPWPEGVPGVPFYKQSIR